MTALLFILKSFILFLRYSRYGNCITGLSDFSRSLPTVYLDSELWYQIFYNELFLTSVLGLGGVNFCLHILWLKERNTITGRFWGIHFRHLILVLTLNRMIAFDVPSYNFQRKPYEERYAALLHKILHSHPFNVWVNII